MPTDYRGATDEIYVQLNDLWVAQAHVIANVSPGPLDLYMEWSDTKQGHGPRNEPWARLAVQHLTSRRKSISSGPGQRCFTRYGQAIVQVFGPQRSGLGPDVTLELAKLVVLAYEGRSTANVRFRQADLREIGRDGPWYQINVAAYFEWDEYS